MTKPSDQRELMQRRAFQHNALLSSIALCPTPSPQGKHHDEGARKTLAQVMVQKTRGVRAPGVSVPLMRRRALRMLECLGLTAVELSVVLTDDVTIHELNKQYRSKDRPTDVLAFAMHEGQPVASGSAHDLLGDVIISLETAVQQAKTHRRELLVEVTHLLAHGLLHLVGYDHGTDAEEREMRRATRVLMHAAGDVVQSRK